jgi:hypothetical protein
MTNALFRLAFAKGSRYYSLTNATSSKSPAHSSTGTRSIIFNLPLLVSIRFHVLFHSPTGVLFTFPSRYYFAIAHSEVFSLTRWSSLIHTEFHVFHATRDIDCFPLLLRSKSKGFDLRQVSIFDIQLQDFHSLWCRIQLLRFSHKIDSF